MEVMERTETQGGLRISDIKPIVSDKENFPPGQVRKQDIPGQAKKKDNLQNKGRL